MILHSEQGSQYTSKAFIEFCESVHVSQSMSKAGCPYDNAPMERYFNTLKNECVNLYEFQTEEALYQTEEEFVYVTYNHIRPHSYNGYRPLSGMDCILSIETGFLAISVTKMLDHNNDNTCQKMLTPCTRLKVTVLRRGRCLRSNNRCIWQLPIPSLLPVSTPHL